MFKTFFASKRWRIWAYGGGLTIFLGLIAQVRIDVAINDWFGTFYDLVQSALAKPGSVTLPQYWHFLLTFCILAGIYIGIAVLLEFLIKHWIFRWRTALSEHYIVHWPALRMIEGASQRVQEDTMRLARLMESLGANLLRALMTLIAFLPILYGLSQKITELPLVGHVPNALLWVAVVFALGGTLLIMFVGRKLPDLEFNNQLVEAAYRKELVLGEDSDTRAAPEVMAGLFRNIRSNYIRLYLHFMYLDFTKYTYLQVGVIVPYIALGPTLIAGGLTLGSMQQIVRAFGRVENALQYVVSNWVDVVELISVYKRLRAFERTLHPASQ